MQLNFTTKVTQVEEKADEKTANDLIPELISKINLYSSKLKDRVKIYSIFREFDTYAHMNFQNFIKMSDKRYRSIKSGNTLKNILHKQQKENNELSTKILSNNMYNDKNIEKEEKKLYKKLNNKESKEIYQIRHDIIEKTKDLTKKELERREKYLISAQKSRNMKNKNEKNKNNIQSNINSIINTNYRASIDSLNKKKLSKRTIDFKTFKNKNSKNFGEINISSSIIPNDTKSKTIVTKRLSQEKEILKSKKDFLDNLVQKDNQNLNANFLDYKQFLNDIQKSQKDNYSHIVNEGKNFGHTFSFKFDNIKLLSFQEEKEEITHTKKKDKNEIDINLLVKYTKRGNKKWFLNNIKLRSKQRQNSVKAKLHSKKIVYNIPNRHLANSALNAKAKEDNIFNKGNIDKEFSAFDSLGKTGSTTFSNFRNTIKTVKNEAKMLQNIGKNFINKRKTMEGFFKRLNLPEIKDYEQMFQTRNKFRNIQQMKNNEINFDNISHISPKSTKNKINITSKKSLKIAPNANKKNAKEEFISEKIFEDMQKTYNSKKEIWATEDLRKENIKKEKMEHIEQTKKYLLEMEHFKRKPHLYVDPYSKRDDIINSRIKLFTRSLSGPFYSKKSMESKIDDFNNYIEQKEKEKKINDRKLAETLRKEELKIREEDIEFQIKQKMKLIFAKEAVGENKKENDIDFNYKFIPTLKVTKKIDGSKSYKDFKEFFETVKNKQKKELYEQNEIEELNE